MHLEPDDYSMHAFRSMGVQLAVSPSAGKLKSFSSNIPIERLRFWGSDFGKVLNNDPYQFPREEAMKNATLIALTLFVNLLTVGCALETRPKESAPADVSQPDTNTDPCYGVVCGTNESCQNGVCVANDPCEGVTCNAGHTCQDGTCVYTACDGKECGANGLGGSCGNCPSGEYCSAGQCLDEPLTHENGSSCDDGNACSTGETWLNDECQGGVAVQCTDGNPCTTDGCNENTGCTFTANALPCDDTNECTIGEQCANALCGNGQATDCNDGNPCTLDNCSPTLGCTFVSISGCCTSDSQCDDGNSNTSDTCSGNVCKHTVIPPTCTPDCSGKVCGADGCGGSCGGCAGGATCQGGSCIDPGPTDGTPCDDGNFCTLNDVYVGGTCTGTTKVCPNNGICLESTGSCFECLKNEDCNAGQVCEDLVCKPPFQCYSNADCGVGEFCDFTDGNVCKPELECYQDVHCDDGNACTTDTCSGNTCLHTAKCNAGQQCNPSNGICTNPPVSNLHTYEVEICADTPFYTASFYGYWGVGCDQIEPYWNGTKWISSLIECEDNGPKDVNGTGSTGNLINWGQNIDLGLIILGEFQAPANIGAEVWLEYKTELGPNVENQYYPTDMKWGPTPIQYMIITDTNTGKVLDCVLVPNGANGQNWSCT